MELRTLRYFVALAQEGSFSAAAKSTHVTQPTLSRQLAALEDELHQQLYLRKHSGVQLTREGTILLGYAQEIVALADKAVEEVAPTAATITGKVHIAAGETQIMGLVARAMALCKERYPGVHFLLYSGTTASLHDGFSKGQYDIMIECEARPHVEYNTYELPFKDVWGVLMRRDNMLARQRGISPDDLRGQKIMYSQQAEKAGVIKKWAGQAYADYEISCAWTLPLNSKYLVREGLGLTLTYAGLFDDDGHDLCFRPLTPLMESTQAIVWRKAPLSRQAQAFLGILLNLCEDEEGIKAMMDNALYSNFD